MPNKYGIEFEMKKNDNIGKMITTDGESKEFYDILVTGNGVKDLKVQIVEGANKAKEWLKAGEECRIGFYKGCKEKMSGERYYNCFAILCKDEQDVYSLSYKTVPFKV